MIISLITVCHKSRQKISTYVNSFLEHHTPRPKSIQYQFVFIENSGDTEFVSAVQPLKNAGFDVVVLNTKNDGFGRGCNEGAKYSTGDILIFANPDIRFLGNLAPLQAYEKQSFWGTVRQLTPSGRMYSIDLFPENKSIFFELLKLYKVTNTFFSFFSHKSYVVGSFFVITKDLFSKSGGFDRNFFLYYEEAELSRRLQAIIGPPLVETKINVFHEGFGSHNNLDEIFQHEANGFLSYCKVTKQPGLLHSRLRSLKILGILSSSSAKRFKALKDAAFNNPQ